MTPDVCTSVLLALACAATVAWLAALMREKGVRPGRGIAAFLAGRPLPERTFLLLFAAALWMFAGEKPSGPGGAPPGFRGPVPESGLPVASTNTARTLTAEDFGRGFVLTRVGTGEAHDFSAPSGATVCPDWLAFGAGEDWIYVALTNWAFQAGTGEIDRLRVHSDGWVAAEGRRFCPLKTTLGIVPEANWPLLAGSARPSRLWHGVTPQDTLLLTWQNALLGRDAGAPVSFQAEFFRNGRFTYRYDFSRLDAESVSGILAGASFGGNAWMTNALPTNVTSLAFHPLSAEDAFSPDPDGDGLPTIDELFVHFTDPHDPDTDHDGLSDSEELLVHGTDPLDPYSTGRACSDGLAVRIGDLDPFSYPEGSTNTVLEHVFYTGTTNGAFAYPRSSDVMAVLRVSVSGSGIGDLIVGDRVVPLVAPPQLRSSPPNPPEPFLLQLVKGVTYILRLRGDETLVATLDSGDFAFGALPAHGSIGHVNFPNTVATTPCIHDFNARRKLVTLPTGADASALECAWSGDGMDVAVENIPPRSAKITGNFSARSTSGIAYTLSHPQHLFGQASYCQTVRFCPRPPDPDPEDPDPPEDPPWYSDGDGDDSGGNYHNNDNGDEHHEHWCCYWGVCGEHCDCGCGGHEESPEDEEDFDEDCPVHGCPYDICACLHEGDYTNAVQNVQHLGGVLYIRDPPLYEQMHLDVPAVYHNCCPCPDHWTNYVGVAYKSHRLRLIDSNGLNFSRAVESCDVHLAGVSPSSSVGDASLAFASNGEIYRQYDKTVLGVAIKGNGSALALCNALNSNFGHPVTVCSNLTSSCEPDLKLVTNVKLPGGEIHLELFGASAPFTIWYHDRRTGCYRKLLDTATTPVKDLSMDYWKAMMRRATVGTSADMPIYVTSSAPGGVSLLFRYWNVIGGRFVQDQAVQRITSVNPPLMADIDHDGAVGDGDLAAWMDGREFRFWTNEDVHKGDYVGQVDNLSSNVADLVVNGRLDLVNFFPVKLDLAPFMDAWGDLVTFRIRAGHNRLHFCGVDVPPEAAWSYQTNDVRAKGGDPQSVPLLLSAAELTAITDAGVEMDPDAYLGGGNSPGVLAFEAVQEIWEFNSPELLVEAGGETLYRFRLPLAIDRVRNMYRWANIRSACGDMGGEASRLYSPWNFPDGESDGRHFVFVHGYNVNPTQARQWADAMFKRLWLSGSRSMFTAVDWYGDSSQFSSLFHGDVSPDYYANAVHAFLSAPALASQVVALPGTNKVMLAHSLGNMLVSSAAKDCGLQYSRYYMLNAAVPMEAYDETEFSQNMVDSAWNGVPLNYRASDWNKLFQACTNDFRFSLSWQGRFAGIMNTVNCYSETEEVLANPTAHSYGEAWAQQELFKGTAVWHGLNEVPFLGLDVACEGGWGINAFYALNPALYTPGYGFHSSVMDDITRKDAIEHPLFTPFQSEAENMHSTNLFVIANTNDRKTLRAKFLADAIPATSFAAGANRIDAFGNARNLNYSNFISEPWPRSGHQWKHSDLKNIAYRYVHRLFEKIREGDDR